MGFNAGIIAGGLLYLEYHFENIEYNAVLKGAVTAAVFASAFLANICVAPLADRFGRTIIIYCTNVFFVAGAGIAATATNAEVIILGRAITGFGVGIAGTLPNLYIAEIVPPEKRGRAVGMAPLYGTSGIMAAQFCSWIIAEILGKHQTTAMGWRYMFAAGAIPPIIQLFWSMGLPESPRWCRQRGFHERAEESLQYLASLGVNMEDGAVTPTPAGGMTSAAIAREEQFGKRRAAIAVGLSVMQQLSGVNAVIYYAPKLYTTLGVAANISILIAGLNSVAQVMMTRIMTLIIDSWGRRTVCLVGLLGMFCGLVLLGFVFQLGVLPVGFAVAGILIFRLSFSLSLGPLPYIMVTELFPQRHRARGVAMSMATNWFLNWGVVFVVPQLLDEFKGLVFFLFAGVCVISAVIVDLWLPETSGRSLDDADTIQHEGLIRKVIHRLQGRRSRRQPTLLQCDDDPNGVPTNISIPKVASDSDAAIEHREDFSFGRGNFSFGADQGSDQSSVNSGRANHSHQLQSEKGPYPIRSESV